MKYSIEMRVSHVRPRPRDRGDPLLLARVDGGGRAQGGRLACSIARWPHCKH